MVRTAFVIGYSAIATLFVACAVVLVGFASLELWHAVDPRSPVPLRGRFNSILESIGLLTIAIAALELGQTIVEEEVQREAQLSAPTRVRRFLSRFLIVIVVALSIECLVAVFQFLHDRPTQLPHAAMVGFAAAALLAAWGLFVRLNRSAEELEPEAMAQVKEEDREVKEVDASRSAPAS